MGRAVQERERAVLRDERRALLEIHELFDRQSLEFRLVGVRAEKAQARFAAREPVDTLAEVAEERHVHLAEQLLDESRTDRRVKVEKPHRSASRPGDAHVARDDFAFPPGVDEVPDRTNLLRVDEFGVVSDVSLLLRGDVTEDELPFGVDVAVLALIPERFIRHLRQQERGFDRIEALGQVQRPVVRGDAFAAHVGDELTRAALCQNALGRLAGARGGRNVSGAPPAESAPSAPSTGTCSLLPSARASRTPWQQRTDAAGYHPAGSVRASGNCARNRVSLSRRSRGWCGTSW